MSVAKEIDVLRDITPCSLVNFHRHLGNFLNNHARWGGTTLVWIVSTRIPDYMASCRQKYQSPGNIVHYLFIP